MIRCPVCDSLKHPDEPCPGCLVELALDRSDRRWLRTLVVSGAVLASATLLAFGVAGWLVSTGAPDDLVEAPEPPVLAGRRPPAVPDVPVVPPPPVPVSARNPLPPLERSRAEAERRRAEADAARDAARARAEAARREAETRRAAAEAAHAAAEAHRLAIEAERHGRERSVQKATLTAELASPSSSTAGVVHGCRDLVALESDAILGKLTAFERSCLEGRRDAPTDAERERSSRLLIIDAFASGDIDRWAMLVEHHLATIDRTDPDLCYKYALHLSRQGVAKAEEVIRWADAAMKRRTAWTGTTYTARVHSLYKMRAIAAEKLWHARQLEVSDPGHPLVVAARERTHLYAREWVEFATVAGKPTDQALELCTVASPTGDRCDVG